MFDRNRSPNHLVNWAGRLSFRITDRRIKPLGLSAGQVTVLLALAESSGLSQKALVQRVAIEQPAMVGLLNRMEREELVSRKMDPADGRASLFDLTEKAKDSLENLFVVLNQGNDEALVGFSEREVALLIDMLQRMVRNLSDVDSLS